MGLQLPRRPGSGHAARAALAPHRQAGPFCACGWPRGCRRNNKNSFAKRRRSEEHLQGVREVAAAESRRCSREEQRHLSTDSRSRSSTDSQHSREGRSRAATPCSSSEGWTVVGRHMLPELQDLDLSIDWSGLEGPTGGILRGKWKGALVSVKIALRDLCFKDLDSCEQPEPWDPRGLLDSWPQHPNIVQLYATKLTRLQNGLAGLTVVPLEQFSPRQRSRGEGTAKCGDGLPVDVLHDLRTCWNPAVRALVAAPKALSVSAGLMLVGRSANGTPAEQMTLVMEYCDRGTLRDEIEIAASVNPDFEPARLGALLTTLLEVARGMAYLHFAGGVHGDLRSGNLLLKSSRLDLRGFIVKIGSPGWGWTGKEWAHVAPEVLHGALPSRAADVYAFGVLMWECLTGDRPGGSKSLEQHREALRESDAYGRAFGPVGDFLRLRVPPSCPCAYKQLIRECLQSQPSTRPSFEEVVDTLEGLEADAASSSLVSELDLLFATWTRTRDLGVNKTRTTVDDGHAETLKQRSSREAARKKIGSAPPKVAFAPP